MKTASTTAVVAVCLFTLSGCENRPKVMPSPQAEAPVLPMSQMVHVPNLPALPPPPLRDVAVASTQAENPEPVHPRKTPRRKSNPAKTTAPAADSATQTADKTTPQPPQIQAATGAAPDASPIGQLSSTSVSNPQGRAEIERIINDTENGLNNIKRTLTSEEQLTSTQIKTFLFKSKQALADNDLDGAQTLANKAKELLGELTKK